MEEKRFGNQLPTLSLILPYNNTLGIEAINIYEQSGRTAQPWQAQLTYDIRAIDDEGLFIHTKFGYEVPRRNGKGEVITQIELDDLFRGRRCLHTAHRTTTSSSASLRLATILKDLGYTEVQRVKKDDPHDKCYVYAKQFGLEKIILLDTGGEVHFRTRTAKGGLGEGFDTLVVDEAQEYTDEQQSSLQYVVSDSANPQIILCGTPPTMVSGGRIFEALRTSVLEGKTEDTGWAEWSVEFKSDVNDVELWYMCNPAMGYQLNERKIRNEDKTDELDFNIQRLGYWSTDNLQSAITKSDWEVLKCDALPNFKRPYFVGIKYGSDGTNVAVSLATKTGDKIFVEGLDCQNQRNGTDWLVDMMLRVNPKTIAIDGAGNQKILADALADVGFKNVILPTVKEIVVANSLFEQAIFGQTICHNGQPSIIQSITNCQKRPIGTNGGFAYRSIKEGVEIALLDSVMLAHWICASAKERKKQQISY